MWKRLRLGIRIGVIAIFTFILLNLLYYQGLETNWLYTNLSQEIVLLCCWGLLYSKMGRNHPEFYFFTIFLVNHSDSSLLVFTGRNRKIRLYHLDISLSWTSNSATIKMAITSTVSIRDFNFFPRFMAWV